MEVKIIKGLLIYSFMLPDPAVVCAFHFHGARYHPSKIRSENSASTKDDLRLLNHKA